VCKRERERRESMWRERECVRERSRNVACGEK